MLGFAVLLQHHGVVSFEYLTTSVGVTSTPVGDTVSDLLSTIYG